MALIYGISALGAAGFAYYRGRRGTELVRDTLCHGAFVGTVVNVGAWAYGNEAVGAGVSAARNIGSAAMGTVGARGIELLSSLDTSRLYAEMREAGVKVAPVPDDVMIVNQDK